MEDELRIHWGHSSKKWLLQITVVIVSVSQKTISFAFADISSSKPICPLAMSSISWIDLQSWLPFFR